MPQTVANAIDCAIQPVEQYCRELGIGSEPGMLAVPALQDHAAFTVRQTAGRHRLATAVSVCAEEMADSNLDR
jgi:hypothetical protein